MRPLESPVTRLSAPDTVLWFRVAPALVTALFLLCLSTALPDVLHDRAWGELPILALFAAASVILSVWRAAVYEVWLSDDILILKRGRRSLVVPVSEVDGVEVPAQSFRFSPIAWMHWTDPTGVHRFARFPVTRSPDWANFCILLAEQGHRARTVNRGAAPPPQILG